MDKLKQYINILSGFYLTVCTDLISESIIIKNQEQILFV